MPFAPGPVSANAGGAMKPNRSLLASVLLVCFSTGAAWSQNEGNQANCSGLPTGGQLKQFLATAPNDGGDAGGLFHGTLMWAAVVNRSGQLCAFATSTGDPAKVWPGSQAIAKAKAFTANAFSNDPLALSTARLYTFIQPGHSLVWAEQLESLQPRFLGAAERPGRRDRGSRRGHHHVWRRRAAYSSRGHIVGGLGLSGDTACTDHESAKRVRDEAGLNPPGGSTVDDIQYSAVDPASPFIHPLCPNTFRNGTFIGTERNASGY